MPVQEEAAERVDGQVDRRRIDRRRASFHRLLYGAFVHARRRGPRRRTDTEAYYVDWYDSRLFGVVIGIFLFSCVDALFTLMLLSLGAEEVNPLMAALIEHDVQTFVGTKLVITGVGLVFLVIHTSFWIGGAIRVSQALHALLASYVTLFFYQIAMLSHAL